MPELPEVETVVRSLAPYIAGRRIEGLEYLAERAKGGARGQDLRGRIIRAVRRVGKRIFLDLDQGLLEIHLRMTGRLLAGAPPGKYTRAILHLENLPVCFDDIRQFGYIRWLPEAPDLGPDVLEIGEQGFVNRLRQRRGRIKAALLDQSLVAGLGNIYADEALFRAGIHPLASGVRVSKRRLQRLYAATLEVLHEALAAGGSSISSYVDAEGRAGEFQSSHRVYGRTGQRCPQCGTPVRRIVVAQRGTHYCPRCQSH